MLNFFEILPGKSVWKTLLPCVCATQNLCSKRGE